MEIEQVAADDWEGWVKTAGAVILDVREPDEWSHGTLPGSVLVPLAALPDSLASLDPASPTLVVCRSGNRSQHAAWFLRASGFEQVANLAGGLHALGMQP